MKKAITTIITLSLFCILNSYSQNTHTISPNPAFDADFTSLKAACESFTVQEGDLLFLHGGAYGNDTISKQVGIVGPGYFLGTNGEASFQATINTAAFQDIYIAPDGESSFITGLQLKYFDINAANVFISRCYLTDKIRLREGSNYTNIEQCYVLRGFYTYKTSPSTLNIKNTFVGRSGNESFYAPNGASIYRKVSGSIQNCIIIGRQSAFWDIGACSNNIFSGGTSGNYFNDGESTFNNNIWVYNLSTYDGVANNQVGVAYSSLFVGSTGNSTDSQWQLSENSLAKNAGVGGTDCGIFGGDNPYILSGLPGIPNIYHLTTPNTANGGGGLYVQIKAKTNP